MRARIAHISWMLSIALGCQGELGVDGDAGMVAADMDAAPVEDMTMVTTDTSTGPDPLCVAVACGTNAVCARGDCFCSPGFMGDPDTGCVPGNPCADVDCSFGSTCNDDGECPCDPGFEPNDLDGCSVVVSMFPEDRTQQEVCARWNSDYPEQAGVMWQTEPVDQCDPGELDPAFQLDAIRRVSLYRWLVGLPAVTTNAEYAQWTQACATMLDATNQGVAIEVGPSLTCYTEQAASGAAGSNLLRGAPSPADSVDVLMEDEGVPDLSHRRWILHPELSSTAFGFRGLYTCMYAIDDGREPTRAFVGYPFGVFPRDALLGPWSFSSDRYGLDAATVTITDGSGADVPVTNPYVASGNFGWNTMAWSVKGATAGQTYTVSITGLTGDETMVTYDVELVDCP